MTDHPAKKQTLQMLDEALTNSDIPWWEWDIPSNTVVSNDLKTSMLGYDPEDFKGKGYEAYTDLLHPEDYERSMDAMRGHLSGDMPIYQIDYRIKKADGTYTWFMDRGMIIQRNDEGKPLKLRGVVLDLGKTLSARARNAAAFKLIRKSLPTGKDEVIVLCSSCRKIRLSDGSWIPVDRTYEESLFRRISHGICRPCAEKLYPEINIFDD